MPHPQDGHLAFSQSAVITWYDDDPEPQRLIVDFPSGNATMVGGTLWSKPWPARDQAELFASYLWRRALALRQQHPDREVHCLGVTGPLSPQYQRIVAATVADLVAQPIVLHYEGRGPARCTVCKRVFRNCQCP
jgi:hypothetical protein